MRNHIAETLAALTTYLEVLKMGNEYNKQGIVLTGAPQAAMDEALQGVFSETFRLRAQRMAASQLHAALINMMFEEGWNRAKGGYQFERSYISDILLDKITPETIEREGLDKTYEKLVDLADPLEEEETQGARVCICHETVHGKECPIHGTPYEALEPTEPEEPLKPGQCAICRVGQVRDNRCDHCEVEFCDTCSGVIHASRTAKKLYDVKVVRPCRCDNDG